MFLTVLSSPGNVAVMANVIDCLRQKGLWHDGRKLLAPGDSNRREVKWPPEKSLKDTEHCFRWQYSLPVSYPAGSRSRPAEFRIPVESGRGTTDENSGTYGDRAKQRTPRV
jgi:hypothetical protein